MNFAQNWTNPRKLLSLYSFIGEFQPFSRQYITHVGHTWDADLTLVVIEGDYALLQFSRDSLQVFVMFLVICTNQSQVVI